MMSYSDEERLRLRAKEGLDVPLESQQAMTSRGHGHPRVFHEMQQLKDKEGVRSRQYAFRDISVQ